MNNEPIINEIPRGRTAFIIIHGVGEQKPFETVDYFGRNWIDYFEKKKVNVKLEHIITQYQVPSVAGAESFVRISSSDVEQDWIVDIHEYYWAYQTQEQITVSEVLRWVEKTLEGTIKFYSQPQNEKLLQELKEKQSSRRQIFQYRLRSLTIFLRLFHLIYPLFRLGLWLVLSVSNPFLSGRFLQSAWTLSKQLLIPPLVNYVGDIAIYTTADAKSPHHQVRQQILTESLALLKSMIRDKEADYDQVILAGHSLGSCIAYDTLNLLSLELSLPSEQNQSLAIDKIAGLITFGSPLDKIAFFFREARKKEQYIRSAILEHLTSFRVRSQEISSTGYLTNNPIQSQLEKLRWINYYHQNDPISGHLDYYQNLENVLMQYDACWGDQAHQGYWTNSTFYEDIAQRFLYTVGEEAKE
jgi:hypothetical protein